MSRLPPPESETYGVFSVKQLTRDTVLESRVGVDDVTLAPGQSSEIHRHNLAETVLYVLEGKGTVIVENREIPVRQNDRVVIRKGQYHGVRTGSHALRFISVQSPPIQDKSSGQLDLQVKLS